jgi:hypothetical protein
MPYAALPTARRTFLAATKEQLQAASKTPDGVWTGAAGSEWARNVDGFYGRPIERNRIDRVDRVPGEPAPGDRSTSAIQRQRRGPFD